MDNDLIVKNNNDIEKLVDQLIQEEDPDKTKEMINLFNINMAKKNTLRVIKVNELLDKVNDEAIRRLDDYPELMNHSDLLNYMKSAQLQLDKSMENIKSINEVPSIQLNQDNSVNINIEKSELSRDSRERVLKAVQDFLAQSENTDSIIDVEVKNKD